MLLFHFYIIENQNDKKLNFSHFENVENFNEIDMIDVDIQK